MMWKDLTQIEVGNRSKGSLTVVRECMGVANYRRFITRNYEDFGEVDLLSSLKRNIQDAENESSHP